MQAATVVTGVLLGPGSARIALSSEVQNNRVPVTLGLRGAAPTTNMSLAPVPLLWLPTAANT